MVPSKKDLLDKIDHLQDENEKLQKTIEEYKSYEQFYKNEIKELKLVISDLEKKLLP